MDGMIMGGDPALVGFCLLIIACAVKHEIFRDL